MIAVSASKLTSPVGRSRKQRHVVRKQRRTWQTYERNERRPTNVEQTALAKLRDMLHTFERRLTESATVNSTLRMCPHVVMQSWPGSGVWALVDCGPTMASAEFAAKRLHRINHKHLIQVLPYSALPTVR